MIVTSIVDRGTDGQEYSVSILVDVSIDYAFVYIFHFTFMRFYFMRFYFYVIVD